MGYNLNIGAVKSTSVRFNYNSTLDKTVLDRRHGFKNKWKG